MRNERLWRPSKFVLSGGTLRASRDHREVAVGSRLIADEVARRYSVAIPQYARGRLIDLGCGRVPLYATYRPHVAAVTCVDWSHSLHGDDHVDVACNLSEPLPFPTGAFDTIVLSDVLEHVAEPGLLWREMARLLAPSGHLLMNVPFYYGLHETPHDYFRYTEFALRRFVEQSSLAMVELQPVGGSAEVLADLCAKHIVRVPLVGPIGAQVLQSVVGAFSRSRAGRKFARRTARQFPLGYFLVATKPVP